VAGNSLAERMARVALNKSAATKRVVKAGNGTASIAKSDDELQVVWGEVYAPNFPDSQGDFMTTETIRNMAYGFMQKSATFKVDVQHDQQLCGAFIVESFVARDDDPVFIAGSWVVGVHIPDPLLWNAVKTGELNGFSLDGFAVRVDKEIEVVIPDLITGRTDTVDAHDHEFFVTYDPATNSVKGYTSKAEDGHWHEIDSATLTKDANKHNHRFSFAEGLYRA
jgi:hypothetical protein